MSDHEIQEARHKVEVAIVRHELAKSRAALMKKDREIVAIRSAADLEVETMRAQTDEELYILRMEKDREIEDLREAVEKKDRELVELRNAVVNLEWDKRMLRVHLRAGVATQDVVSA